VFLACKISIFNHFRILDLIDKIAIVGTGNVAHHLATIFTKNNVEIACIASRNPKHAYNLATKFDSTVSEITLIKNNVDLVIIAVSDDAIAEVVQKIPTGDYIVAHTSGSVSIDVFKNKFKKYGVFYPLQSISKSRELNFSEIPILVEGNTNATTNELFNLAKLISNRVEKMGSDNRGLLHLSAVIANNFVNFLAAKSYGFLEQNNIDGNLLQPLMEETIARIKTHHPSEMQTGPAKRNDKKVIKKQIKQLESDPKLQSLYRLISQQIIEEYHGGKL
jgi:predicted short-subunit dehydrogenase-like oxidoreductase (DUF2520 family)